MLMTTERQRGKHTCSKTNKKGKKKKKNGQLMATRKQVGPIEKYTVTFDVHNTHTQKLFLLMLAIYKYTRLLCKCRSSKKKKRDMLVKTGQTRTRLRLRQQTFGAGAPAELQLGGVALNVFRYSPQRFLPPSTLYRQTVYRCVWFFFGLYIYTIEMFSLSDDEQ